MVDLLTTYRIPCGLYVRKRKSIIIAPLLIQISVLLTILVLIFGRVDVFVWLLGFIALGLESTLPIPQFMTLVTSLFKDCAFTVLYLSSSSNYKQKSLYGFRMSTLIGWVGGDSFKYSHPCTHARLQTGNS